MQTPQVTDPIEMVQIGDAEPHFMPERKARALAAQLQREDNDGWRYRVIILPRGSAVQVYDEMGSLGYL